MADLSLTASAVVPTGNANIQHGIAGATITAGQVVYKDSSTGQYGLSDANGASTDIKSVAGVALNGASAGQPLAMAVWGDVTMNAVFTAGTAYYLSANPGGICPVADLAAGDVVVQIGIAKSTTVLSVHPQAPGVTL